jgi:hypothetical protein
MKWTLKLCVPIASAAVLVGCTQEVETNPDQRTAIDGTDQTRQDLRVSLTGCLGTGPGTNQYVLTHVRPAPLTEQPSGASPAANINLPGNSAVRLASNEDHDLAGLVGRTVSVTGLLSDDGRNTIGTSGEAQQPAPGGLEPRADQSQAATDQHHSEKVREEAGPIGNRSMNNGSYPEITVHQVTQTGEQCVTNPAGQDRR